MVIDGVNVKVLGFVPSKEELRHYICQAKKIKPNADAFVFTAEGDAVKVDWVKNNQKFERIRRITGYLTGDLNSWNDAKQAEEQDRVKHETRV
ncbi:MAG: hypothetical protein II857_12740 [Selenomonadaceae bacterium]|nr:hypothetical protein [Selenomonadaceae bacterium]